MKSSLHAGDRWRDWQNDVSLVANIENGLLANIVLYTLIYAVLWGLHEFGLCDKTVIVIVHVYLNNSVNKMPRWSNMGEGRLWIQAWCATTLSSVFSCNTRVETSISHDPWL